MALILSIKRGPGANPLRFVKLIFHAELSNLLYIWYTCLFWKCASLIRCGGSSLKYKEGNGEAKKTPLF